MSKTNFLGHAAIYSLTNGLDQVGSFVMLIIYTSLLPPEEYGAYVLLTCLAETVSMILLVGGFRQTFLTLYQQGETHNDRQRVLVGTYSFFLVAGLLGGTVLALLAGPIWAGLGIEQPSGALSGPVLLRLAFLSVLIDPFCIVPMILLQVRLESRLYLLLSVSRVAARLALCSLLMFGLGLGIGGALLGTVMLNATFATCMAVRELRRGIVWPDRALILDMFRFALPFLPASLCFFVLHQGDRFFLTPWGTEQIGLYELGYKLAQLVAPFTLVPLLAVWNSRMYQVARTPEAPEVFGCVFTWIVSAYMLFGLGVLLFVNEGLALAAKTTYSGAALYTPLILIACTLQTMSSLMDSAFYVRKRTDLKLYVTLAATVVMLLGYSTLIPWLGAVGAALATIVGFAFLMLTNWWTTRQIFPVRYQPGRLLAFFGLLVVAWSIGLMIPMGWVTSPLKFLVWLAVPALSWQLGLISTGEKEYLAHIGQNLLARWRQPGLLVRKMPPHPQADAA